MHSCALCHVPLQFLDGKTFESSRERGRPFQFKVGVNQVIKGMDMAVKQMSRGQRSKVIVPPELAYGEEGRYPLIPPSASLLFEVRAGVLPLSLSDSCCRSLLRCA